MSVTLLLADNTKLRADSISSFLKDKGYKVITTYNIWDTMDKLRGGEVDIAIIDMRLVNDEDKDDYSGINIARMFEAEIPKIIMTKFPDHEAVRKALGVRIDKLPRCVDFLYQKDDSSFMESLLTTIRSIPLKEKSFKSINANITTKIDQDYVDVRSQQWSYFIAAFFFSVVSIVLIFIGVNSIMSEKITLGILQGAIGVLSSSGTYLLFRRTDIASKRMDKYHKEKISSEQLENLLLASTEVDDLRLQEEIKKEIILIVAEYWFSLDNEEK